MIKMKFILFLIYFLGCFFLSFGQQNTSTYWNNRLEIKSFRLPLPPYDYIPKVVDLNCDGTPDAIFSMTRDSIPVLWLDDNGDMRWNDLEGDTSSDCLLIDRNKDGIYGGHGDLVIDWVDTDHDGKPDLQIVAEYPKQKAEDVWPNGHYMIVLDTDRDGIFNNIDWNCLEIKSWERSGICDFYTDYSGQSAFLKIHAATYNMQDVRLNWENPFLFYDEDGDGLSEVAIRLLDSLKKIDNDSPDNSFVNSQVNGFIDWVSVGIDMDNDNGVENEFDFDLTLNFRGKGFYYMDQVHKINNVRKLPKTDTFFIDPRFRQITELIYPDHSNAWNLIFDRGEWNKVYFTFDEDDDCHRWERVELYDPLDPFKVGWGNGGLDNNSQSDASGDRGEWDLDNSGKGKLYVSKFDGRLHLYGAEWGCWRIDQNTEYYQGWDRLWTGSRRNPQEFATVKYEDVDGNGFFDTIKYDMDGDQVFETIVSLKNLGINDVCELIDTSTFKYENFTDLMCKMAHDMWSNALLACKVAEKYGVNTFWYAKLKQAASIRKKYDNGYWLQYYLYKDLEYLFLRKQDKYSLDKLNSAYYAGNWNLLLME